MNKLNKTKYIIFFRRVSTKGQELEMQISADAIFRKEYLPDEILILEEKGVSVNKLSISERPKMQKLITMIRNKQVKKVYAFDRSRLFRDFYESNYFFSICRKNDVKVLFTSAGYGSKQVSGDILVEGVYSIVGDEEGSNIARRTEEARKRYPPRKFGYIKNKETKGYYKDPQKEKLLNQYFKDLLTIKSFSDLTNILQVYRKRLGRNPAQLIKTAQDPFYASYDLSTGENKLNHVAPYLTLGQFQELQKKDSLFIRYIERIQHLQKQNIFDPYCGICKKTLNFRINFSEGISQYSCSNKHSKVVITTDDLKFVIDCALKNVIDNLDTNRLLRDSKHYYQRLESTMKEDLSLIESEKKVILNDIILNNGELNSWRQHPSYQKLKKVETQQNQLLSQINTKQEYLIENQKLIKLVKEYLENCRKENLFFIASMLVDKIYIYHNEIKLNINKFDYIGNLKNDYIFQGDALI